MDYISDKTTTYIIIALMFFAVPIRIDRGDHHSRTFHHFIDVVRKVQSEELEKSPSLMLKMDDKSFSVAKGTRDNKKLSPYKIPIKLDWRDHGILTAIRSQGSCGSCYAQSVIATIESSLSLRYNLTEPIALSVQQMIDCATSYNFGCQGGDTCDLLEWLSENNIPILPEEYYPSTPNASKCRAHEIHIQNPNTIIARVISYSCLNFVGREHEMVIRIAKYGPLTASVNALLWKNYLGGIIQYHCNSTLNHAVEVIGYDLSVEVPYFIVRNSWGTDFGNGGYARIAIGRNVCGIASEVATISAEIQIP